MLSELSCVILKPSSCELPPNYVDANNEVSPLLNLETNASFQPLNEVSYAPPIVGKLVEFVCPTMNIVALLSIVIPGA